MREAAPFTSLRGHLLVSLPSLQQDYFSRSVTLLVEHNRDGAFGLVVSNPLEADLAVLLADHDIDCPDDITLLESGPVEQDRLFFLHSSDRTFENSVAVNEAVQISTSLDLLDAIARGEGPADLVAGLGYAGWSGGQLESEIQADVWLVTPYIHEVVFRTPFEKMPEAAARAIGIDLNLISPVPGHD
ncbi:MAG: YqgE/AlgH family protein [Proteobacteria bacterium]|nr:YqgE/AlgH family protein [Pseudomonadota bacterium]